MSNPFQEARASLQNIPEEIFQLWLDDRIKSRGWPPLGINWHGYLLGHPLSFWQETKWSKEFIKINYDSIADISKNILDDLMDSFNTGRVTLTTMFVGDSIPRMNNINKYISETNKLPGGPIIVILNNGLLEIVEGNHRVAVLLALQDKYPNKYLNQQIAWVGRQTSM